jgi:hypothetical protein
MSAGRPVRPPFVRVFVRSGSAQAAASFDREQPDVIAKPASGAKRPFIAKGASGATGKERAKPYQWIPSDWPLRGSERGAGQYLALNRARE